MTTVANTCYEQVKTLLHTKMDGIKKSILYDIRKGFKELQDNLLLNIPQQVQINPISALKEVIELSLPTTTLNDFKTLDSSIEINEKKEALVISCDYLFSLLSNVIHIDLYCCSVHYLKDISM